MSFSSDAKTELCRDNAIQKKCCAVAECFGILLYCNTFTIREIRIITGNESFATRLPKLFKKAFGFTIDLPENSKSKTKFSYVMTEKEKISKIFEAFGYAPDNTLSKHINLAILEDDCCKSAFVRGAFLAGGSITEPTKRYHLEMVTDHAAVNREGFHMLNEMELEPKSTSRGGHHILYFKNSEAIEEFFVKIGAKLSAMEIMQTKVEKNMRNAVNRRVNCDNANADKIVNAAQEQLEAIRRIERTTGLENLPQKLQETALLRVANPEASLSDLANLSNPPVSKSCLGHRIKKIIDLSNPEK